MSVDDERRRESAVQVGEPAYGRHGGALPVRTMTHPRGGAPHTPFAVTGRHGTARPDKGIGTW